MKKIFVLLLCLKCFSGYCQDEEPPIIPQITELHETFAFPRTATLTSSGVPYKNQGWNVAYSSAGTVANFGVHYRLGYSTSAPLHAQKYVLNSPYGYLQMSATSTSIWFYNMSDKTINITRAGKEVVEAQYTTAHNATNVKGQVCFFTDNAWFCRGGGQTQTGAAGSVDSTAFQNENSETWVVPLDNTGNQWFPLTYTSGSTLSLGTTGQNLPAGTPITKAGILFTRTSGTSGLIRMDDFIIKTQETTLPIPPAPSNVYIQNNALYFTPTVGFSSPGNYQYTETAGGAWLDCTAFPQPLTASSLFLPGQVGVRVKETGANNYSETAWILAEVKQFPLLSYKEPFPYVGTTVITELGWKVALGTAADVSSQSALINSAGSPDIAPLSPSHALINVNGYISRGTTGPIALYYMTNTIDLPRTGYEIERVLFDHANDKANDSTAWIVRPAFKTSDNFFYAYGSGVQTVRMTNFTSFKQENIPIDFSAPNFYKITLTEGTALSVSTTPESLPAGNLKALAFLGQKSNTGNVTSMAMRIDNARIVLKRTAKPFSLHFFQQ